MISKEEIIKKCIGNMNVKDVNVLLHCIGYLNALETFSVYEAEILSNSIGFYHSLGKNVKVIYKSTTGNGVYLVERCEDDNVTIEVVDDLSMVISLDYFASKVCSDVVLMKYAVSNTGYEITPIEKVTLFPNKYHFVIEYDMTDVRDAQAECDAMKEILSIGKSQDEEIFKNFKISAVKVC